MEFLTAYLMLVFVAIPLLIDGGGKLLGFDPGTIHTVTYNVIVFFLVFPALDYMIKITRPSISVQSTTIKEDKPKEKKERKTNKKK